MFLRGILGADPSNGMADDTDMMTVGLYVNVDVGCIGCITIVFSLQGYVEPSL